MNTYGHPEKNTLVYNAGKWPQKFLAQTQMEIQRCDVYPVFSSVPIPGSYNYIKFQDTLEHQLIPFLSVDIPASIKFKTPFWFTPQAHSWYDPSDVPDQLREPSAYEIKVMANLGIAYGAKGIQYYLFSHPVQYNGVGFLEDDDPINPKPRYKDTYGNLKWDIIRDLNSKIASQGSMLMLLTWDTSYNIHNSLPSGRYITNVVSNLYPLYSTIPENYPYVQLSFFDNIPSDNNKERFYVLNRRTMPDEYRTIQITYDKTLTNPNNHVNWTIREVSTNNYWCSGVTGSFQTRYDPAEGKLFTLEPTVLNGGDLISNETISGTNALTGSLSIKSGATLTVNGIYNIQKNITIEYGGEMVVSPGATLNFSNGATININGGTLTSVGNTNSKITYQFNSGPGIVVGVGVSNPNVLHDPRDGFRGSINISNSIIKDADIGISDNAITRFNDINGLTISNSEFNKCNIGVSASNLLQENIVSNKFTDCGMGMFLSLVQNVNIISNNLISTRSDSLGIMLNSCSGIVRNNSITGFNYGIMLANSSPLIGDNKIFDNSVSGIYIGTGSQPNMKGYLTHVENCSSSWLVYPLSGYNKIYHNGNTLTGSQIYFDSSSAVLENGYNLIANDSSLTSTLLAGSLPNFHMYIVASNNCWGEKPYNPDRFTVPIRVTPINCTFPIPDQSITQCPLVITDLIDGSVIDSVYSLAVSDQNLSDIETKLAQADELMRLGQYDAAKLKYSQVISLYADSLECFSAYAKLRLLGTIQNSSPEVFSQLEDLYNSAIGGVTDDTLMVDMLSHLANLCLISENNVSSAINRFNQIVVSHPGTDEATFATIDAMTASLLLDTTNTGLHKMTNNPYKTKGPQDYNSRVRNLLANKFVSKTNTTNKLLLPTEYSLSQNYPNPFNPTTTIKYTIKERSDIKLTIFDLLGRHIKTLVNEVKEPGFYQIEFDGSRLASGVYFYTLFSKHFVKTNKMIILK